MKSNWKLFAMYALLSVFSGVLGGVICNIFMNRSAVRDLKVHSLQLIDENRKTRAALEITRDEPSLLLIDESGAARASFSDDPDGPRLQMSGNDPWSGAVLRVFHDKPMLAFGGDGREGRVIIGYSVDDDTLPSVMGHWGLTVSGKNRQYMALGTAMREGQEYDSFANLLSKHAFKPSSDSIRNPVPAPLTPSPQPAP